MTSTEFIDGAFDLFTDTMFTALSEPLFAFLAIVPLALVVVVLIGATVKGAKRM